MTMEGRCKNQAFMRASKNLNKIVISHSKLCSNIFSVDSIPSDQKVNTN